VTSLNTITPFTASQTGLAALNITAAGTAYTVGDTVTITEVGGTPGVATAVIDSVS
jgi:hypothetical protein